MKKKIKGLMSAVLVMALVVGIMQTPQMAQAEGKEKLSSKGMIEGDDSFVYVEKGTFETIKIKNAKRKIKWTIISGKKNIRLKNKKRASVDVVGKKDGSAKIKAEGKRKITCTIIIIQKNKKDFNALKKLVKEQKARGANMSQDFRMTRGNQYSWNVFTGELLEINWNGVGLSGQISFSELKNLRTLDVTNNQLTEIDVSECKSLRELKCDQSVVVKGCDSSVEVIRPEEDENEE